MPPLERHAGNVERLDKVHGKLKLISLKSSKTSSRLYYDEHEGDHSKLPQSSLAGLRKRVQLTSFRQRVACWSLVQRLQGL